MPASEKGIQLLGVAGNVAMIKFLDSSKTTATKPGRKLKLKGREYEVFDIRKFRSKGITMELLDGDQHIVLYRDRFPIPAKYLRPEKKAGPAKPKPVLVEGSFQEKGFEREFDKNGRGKILVSESYKKNLIKDLGTVLMQASAEPVENADGSLMGFLLDQIDKGSIFEKMGFQNGDVITEIDGQLLNSPAMTLSILQGLRNKSEVQFRFKRSGRDVPMTINVQ